MVDCLLVHKILTLYASLSCSFQNLNYVFYMQASPKLRFNKEGSLLAVTANENAIKVVANHDGQRMLRMLEGRTFDGSRGFSEAANVKVHFCFLLYIFFPVIHDLRFEILIIYFTASICWFPGP